MGLVIDPLLIYFIAFMLVELGCLYIVWAEDYLYLMVTSLRELDYVTWILQIQQNTHHEISIQSFAFYEFCNSDMGNQLWLL
jgi:hypothetical protein